jgi:hypothetical protein
VCFDDRRCRSLAKKKVAWRGVMRWFRGRTRRCLVRLLVMIGCFQQQALFIIRVESLAALPPTTTTRSKNYHHPITSVRSSWLFPSTPEIISHRDKVRRPAKRSPLLASTSDENNDDEHEGTWMTSDNNNNNDQDKFGFGQRIESLKCLVLGAMVGSLALAPLAFLGDVVFPLPYPTNPIAQWEFDNDMAGLQTGLFAMVYRYAIRSDGSTNHPQLHQGVVAAFAVTRTLSRMVTPTYCTAITLNCGPPLGYFDWSMLGQLSINYIESAAMFGATAAAMDWAMKKKFISKFPG